MERGRRLGDAEAFAAGELLAHMLNNLEARGHIFERLGDVFAELAQSAAAIRTAGWGRMQKPLAR